MTEPIHGETEPSKCPRCKHYEVCGYACNCQCHNPEPVAWNAEGRKRCPHGLPTSECKPCQVQASSSISHSDELRSLRSQLAERDKTLDMVTGDWQKIVANLKRDLATAQARIATLETEKQFAEDRVAQLECNLVEPPSGETK